jgi:hypothetical protein
MYNKVKDRFDDPTIPVYDKESINDLSLGKIGLSLGWYRNLRWNRPAGSCSLHFTSSSRYSSSLLLPNNYSRQSSHPESISTLPCASTVSAVPLQSETPEPQTTDARPRPSGMSGYRFPLLWER